MANTTVDSGVTSAPPDLSLFSRLVGVITSPKATYQSIVAHPTWLGMMLLTIAVTSLLVGGFLFTKVGQEAWLDAAIARSGQQMTDQQIAGMERIAPLVGYFSVGGILVFVPVMYLMVSGVLYAVFNAALGGTASFKQVLSVVTHAGAVGLLGQFFTVPLNYMRGVMTSGTNLAVAMPFAEESFLGRLLGTIDLFLVWQLIVLAIGLGVLYRKRTQPIAITLFVVYGLIALIIATVRSSFGGSN
jgi:hypothetical protein